MTTRPTPRTRLAAFALVGGEASQNREPTGTEGDLTVAQYQGNNRLGFVTFVWSPQSRLLTTTTASVSSHNARDFDSYLAPGVSKSVIEPFERNIAVDDLAVRQQVLHALSPRLVVDSGVEWHQLRSRWVMRGIKPPVFWRGLGPSTWGEGIQYPAGGVIESRLARSHTGLWTQAEVALGSALFLEPGVRLDWNSYTHESSWQPKLRLRGRIGETTWWTGIAAQVQTPSHESLQGFDYFHFSKSNVERLWNARGLQAVAGVERRLLARTNLRIEAYHRRFDRLLVQRLETEAERTERFRSYTVPADMPADSAFVEFRPTIYPESTGGGTARGIEVLVRHEGSRFGGWIGYALARTEQQMHGYTFLSDFDRSHALSAVATFRIARRWAAAATWRQTSGFAVTPITEDVLFLNNPRPDGTLEPVARPARHSDGSLMLSPNPFVRPLAERNSERLGVYSRTDARLTYSTLGRWEVYGEVINLFGARNYSQVIPAPSFARGEAPDSKQNVYELFERIPAFGIRVRF